MRTASAKNFACPECKGDLTLNATQEAEGRVVEGSFHCAACARDFPISKEIPRFITELLAVEEHSAKSFGYKWKRLTTIDDHLRKAFLDELPPLEYRTFFKGKVVLDGGTGIGIPSTCMSELGAKEVYGVDISTAIQSAHANTRELNNVTIAQADIYKMPFKRASFDVVVCVAVLQHLRDPKSAFDELLSFVKPGGTLVIWVYGDEGNGFARYFIEPFRKLVTRRLPLAVVMGMSYLLAVLFQFIAVCIYKPFNKLGVKLLPSQDYIAYRGEFTYMMNMWTIFDQLLAPLSYLFRKDEVEGLFKNPDIASFELRHHNGNSWTGIGTKK